MKQLTSNDIDRIFDETYNGEKNFITPCIIRRGKQGRYLYELSTGDVMGAPLYGVTVLTLEGERCKALNDCPATSRRA